MTKEYDDFYNEHVPYEIGMLQNAYVCLEATMQDNIHMEIIKPLQILPEQFLFNLFHEDFCLHFYNLYKLFVQGTGITVPQKMSNFYISVYDQVTSLTVHGRIADMSKKINWPEHKEAMDWIISQFEIFKSNRKVVDGAVS